MKSHIHTVGAPVLRTRPTNAEADLEALIHALDPVYAESAPH